MSAFYILLKVEHEIFKKYLSTFKKILLENHQLAKIQVKSTDSQRNKINFSTSFDKSCFQINIYARAKNSFITSTKTLERERMYHFRYCSVVMANAPWQKSGTDIYHQCVRGVGAPVGRKNAPYGTFRTPEPELFHPAAEEFKCSAIVFCFLILFALFYSHSM